MAKIDIKTTLGETIFSYDDEVTDLKTAITEAAARGVDFSYVDFYKKDVSGACFRGANLFSANFRVLALFRFHNFMKGFPKVIHC